MKAFKLLALCTTLVCLPNFSVSAYDIFVRTYIDVNCNGVRDGGEPLADFLTPIRVTLRYCDAIGCTDDVVLQRFTPGFPAPDFEPAQDLPVTDASIEVRMRPPANLGANGPDPFDLCVKVDPASIPAGYTLVGWEAFDPICPCTPIDNLSFTGAATDNDLFGPDTTTDCIQIPFVLPGPSLEIGIKLDVVVVNCNLEVTKTATPDTIIPDPGPVCDKDNKPTSLTFKYTGGGCGASTNLQEGKHKCNGAIDPSSPIMVMASGKKKGTVYDVSPAVVMPEEEFVVSASKFESDSVFVLMNSGGVETDTIHTSCSKKLEVGDVFGSLTLTAIDGAGGAGGTPVTYTYTVTNNGTALTGVMVDDDNLGPIAGPLPLASGEMKTFTVTALINATTTNMVTVTGTLANNEECGASASATVTVEESVDSCASGKPQVLGMRYTGDDCSASNNPQGGKHKCEGDPDDASPVFIRASDKPNPNDPRAKVWFEGTVNIDDLFEIDATVLGQSRLKSDTCVHIFASDLKVNLLQMVKFHTSCSKPLNVGDQFGSLVLETFVAE